MQYLKHSVSSFQLLTYHNKGRDQAACCLVVLMFKPLFILEISESGVQHIKTA